MFYTLRVTFSLLFLDYRTRCNPLLIVSNISPIPHPILTLPHHIHRHTIIPTRTPPHPIYPLTRTPPVLSLTQFSMAHAQLELNVNCSPTIALKVLTVARTSYPSAASDVRYICMLCRVLTILGDLKQIRWIFQTIIGEAVVITPPMTLVAGAANLVTSGLTEITSGFGDKGNARGPKPTTPGSGTCHLVRTDLGLSIPYSISYH